MLSKYSLPARLGLARRGTGRFPVGRLADGLVGRWAGGLVASKNIMIYYFCWPLILAIIIQNRIVYQSGLFSCNGQTSQIKTAKMIFHAFYFKCEVWPLQPLDEQSCFLIIIFSDILTNDESNFNTI